MMARVDKHNAAPIRLRRHFCVLAAAWTLVIVGMWSWNLYHQKTETLESARHHARTAFDKDIVYRDWAADHGGVYVPITETTQPNPYLTHIEERDITTPSGRKLTLVDPAYMTRQVNELGMKQYGLRGHMTSLNPLRPENKADAWETSALKSFEEKAEEISCIEEIDGEPYLRLMRPLVTGESCLKCHADQGYKVGDLRGGISVSVPMDPLYAIGRSYMYAMSCGLAILWVLGLISIGLSTKGLKRQISELNSVKSERLRLATAIEQAAESITIINPDGVIQFVNPAFEELAGCTFDEAVGATWESFLDKTKHPEGVPEELYQKMRQADPWQGRLFIKTKESPPRLVETTVSPVRDPSSGVGNFVCISRDVTKEVEMEARLRQAEKMQVIGTLAGGIAHDFNNILFAIIGFAELTEKKLPEHDHLRDNIREVVKAANRAAGLVQQILVFSHRMEPELHPLLIQDIIEQERQLLRSSFPSTIDMRFHIDPNSGVVHADPTQIHQVIMNICTNSYHAMGESGGTLDIDLRECKVNGENTGSKVALEPGSYVCLKIGDTGYGMSEETMERIFEPYYTTKDRGTGTGLGLATVHGIVTKLGGAIDVHSELGHGTIFSVYFPRFTSTAQPKPEDNPDTALPEGTERILFVDDETQLVRLHETSLARLGYSVEAFSDSAEALAAFQADPDGFDLVITDLTMPKLTGIELTRRIKQLRPNIPILLCTGDVESIIDDKSKMSGIWGYLQKPIRLRTMANTIRQVLEKTEAVGV